MTERKVQSLMVTTNCYWLRLTTGETLQKYRTAKAARAAGQGKDHERFFAWLKNVPAIHLDEEQYFSPPLDYYE